MTHDHPIPWAWSCAHVGAAGPTRFVAKGLAARAMCLPRPARSSARLSVSGFPPGSASPYPTPRPVAEAAVWRVATATRPAELGRPRLRGSRTEPAPREYSIRAGVLIRENQTPSPAMTQLVKFLKGLVPLVRTVRRRRIMAVPKRLESRYRANAMIPRLDMTHQRHTSLDQWPDHKAQRGSLYEERRAYRKFVVMADADTIDDQFDIANLTKAGLLADLLKHDLVRLYRYGDSGPPAGTPAEPGHPDHYPGWILVHHRDRANQSWAASYKGSPHSYSSGGIMGNAVQIAGADSSSGFYQGLSPAQQKKRREADALAAQVAVQALQTDLYVTERPYLCSKAWLTRGVTACGVEDSLAVLGLYLRSQGEFVVADRCRFNRGLYFWVGTRELLPDAWRWFGACVQNSTGAGNDDLLLLGGSLLQRVQRALEARDAIHLALNRPQNNDTQQEALSNLDVALMFLMGAVDVAARVAHRALGITSAEYRAAWQDTKPRGWLASVRPIAPNLAQIVDPGVHGERVLTILRLLRNAVHGAALQGIAFVNGSAPMQSLVALPAGGQPELISAFQATGGEASWGASSPMPDRWHLDPGVFCDRLFEEVIALLNDLMRETPVERLPHVNLSVADTQPPSGGDPSRSNLFDPWIRSSIRWELGF
jgi:hypothetical protein